MQKLKNSRFVMIIVFSMLLIMLTASTAWALSGCPKGKTFCDHPCGQFIDTNSNGTCDRLESTASNGAAEENQITTPNDYAPGTVQDQSEIWDETNSSDSNASDQSVQTENDATDELTDTEQNAGEDESAATDSLIEEDAQNQTPDTAGNTITKNLFTAMTEPIFIVTLLLLLAAYFLTKLNYSLSARLGFLTLGLIILGFYFKGCMCPVGVLANLPLHLAGILKGQYMLWLLLLLLPVVFIFFAGRIYCGGVCPFGTVQELIFRAGHNFGLNQGRPGLQNLSWLKYVKYITLLSVLLITPLVGVAWWCKIDPFYYLFNFTGSKIALYTLAGLVCLSLFISRPWCRFLCPYGALLGILNKDINLLKSKITGNSSEQSINLHLCKNCGKCAKTCPVDAIKNCTIDLNECINCGECSQQCKFSAIT